MDNKEVILKKLRNNRFDFSKFIGKTEEKFIVEKQGLFKFASKYFINSIWVS
jgi:hypothetical protein